MSRRALRDRNNVGRLTILEEAGGATFDILQDTPAFTSDAQGVYALNFVLPANSLTKEGGILVCMANADYSFAAGAGSPHYGLVLYNAGDTFDTNSAPALSFPAGVLIAAAYNTAAVYLDSAGNVVFQETSTCFTSTTTPNQGGGAGSGGSQILIPNHSGVLDFTQAVTCQLVFYNNGPVVTTRTPTYLSGYSRLILVN